MRLPDRTHCNPDGPSKGKPEDLNLGIDDIYRKAGSRFTMGENWRTSMTPRQVTSFSVT